MYALGRTDPALAAELGRLAGLNAEPQPLTSQEVEQLVSEVMTRGDAERGEAIFRRADLNCLKCHAVAGAGGDVGPDLSAVGSSSPVDYLIHSVLLPDQAIKEEFRTLVVLTADGQVFQGIVADRDENRIVLKEATGERRVIPTAEIEDQKEGGSLMPKGLTNITTHGELVDLVRFLSELGKPGPYAIRATPTIQRWRVLTTVPEGLSRSAPDAATFLSQVLGAPEGLWAPAYARVSGALPLDELTATTRGPVLYRAGLRRRHGLRPGHLPPRFRLRDPGLGGRSAGPRPRLVHHPARRRPPHADAPRRQPRRVRRGR
jgi:putative heme-binding domain-containing protein